MIKVINYKNKSIEKPLEDSIDRYYSEVRKVLPGLPKTIQIYFSDYAIVPETGVGGLAYASDIITISIDPEFKNKKKQLKELRSTIFHESFHIYQKFTSKSGSFTAIENAIYEGMATIFEREYCGIWQPYGDYRKTPDTKLIEWVKELQRLSPKDFDTHYREWKFYHPEYKERWIIYKAGTWMVDKILSKQKLAILDLSNLTANEVQGMFEQ